MLDTVSNSTVNTVRCGLRSSRRALPLLLILAGAALVGASYLRPAWAPAGATVEVTGDRVCPLRTKNIEAVKIGDYVWAKDPNESGPPQPHRVLATPTNSTEHLVHVATSAGGNDLQATRSHPFWTKNRGWVKAKDLIVGDQVEDEQGRPVSIARIWEEARPIGTFNLTVEGAHTYYVLAGDSPVLVHNVCGPTDDAVAQAQEAYPNKAGMIEDHHITPKYLGGAADGPTVSIDATYHQQITNAFRQAAPYGGDYSGLTGAALDAIKQAVYSNFPLP